MVTHIIIIIIIKSRRTRRPPDSQPPQLHSPRVCVCVLISVYQVYLCCGDQRAAWQIRSCCFHQSRNLVLFEVELWSFDHEYPTRV